MFVNVLYKSKNLCKYKILLNLYINSTKRTVRLILCNKFYNYTKTEFGHR